MAAGSDGIYHGAMIWVLLVLVLMIPLLAVVLDSQLGQALARRVERRSLEDPRVEALEAEVDRLVAEVERLAERAEFVDRLLTEEAERQEPRLPPGEPLG